jgi:hypothetical protein
MIQQQTDNYIKICLKSWLLCESCTYAEMNSMSPRYDLIAECTVCAETCFALVTKLISNSDDLGDLPFKCVVHCRQCYDECQKYPDAEGILVCGDACALCA